MSIQTGVAVPDEELSMINMYLIAQLTTAPEINHEVFTHFFGDFLLLSEQGSSALSQGCNSG